MRLHKVLLVNFTAKFDLANGRLWTEFLEEWLEIIMFPFITASELAVQLQETTTNKKQQSEQTVSSQFTSHYLHSSRPVQRTLLLRDSQHHRDDHRCWRCWSPLSQPHLRSGSTFSTLRRKMSSNNRIISKRGPCTCATKHPSMGVIVDDAMPHPAVCADAGYNALWYNNK